MIIIRKMTPNEAITVKKLAKKAFGIVEGLFVSTPKEAMVAVADGKIVGGIHIKYIVAKDKKIGYFDAAFIDPHYHGQGIGAMLYKETTKYLWEQGCDALSAFVKDDNVGSWKLFLNNGFSQISIREGIHQLGAFPMLLQYFTTPFFISNGMELYLTVKNQRVQPKKIKTGQQISLYLLANFLLILFSLIGGKSHFLMFISAYLILLAGGLASAYIGTLFSKRQWQFRLNSGGAIMVAFINMVSAYPMIGNWYPKLYENTKEFRKSMGITALCEWLFLLCATALSMQINGTFFHSLSQLGSIFLIYRILIFYPFESFGGRRVYLWNKWLYALLTGLSIPIILMLNYIK